MTDYIIGEISGKQYKIMPQKPFVVAFAGESDKASLSLRNKDIEAKVLMMVEDGKVKLGKPYLKEKITLKRLGNTKGEKIRVSKFHAKANYRRTTGYRSKLTQVVWEAK